MRRLLCVLVAAFPVSLPVVAQTGDNVLKFERKIGVGGGDRWTGWMSFVAFKQNGRMVASDGPARRHDSEGGLTLWSFPEGRLVKSIGFRPWAISRDWRYYASEHQVIDIESGTPVFALTESDDERALPTFSDDGQYVAFSTTPGRSDALQIRVLRAGDGAFVSRFGRRAVFSLAFDPRGETLASGHWDNVTLWRVLTGERLALLRGFRRYVQGIGFSADGAFLAAGTDDGRLQVWDVTERRRLLSIRLGGGEVSTPVFSPDGQLVAAGVYGTGAVWVVEVSSGKIVGQRPCLGPGMRFGGVQSRWTIPDRAIDRWADHVAL